MPSVFTLSGPSKTKKARKARKSMKATGTRWCPVAAFDRIRGEKIAVAKAALEHAGIPATTRKTWLYEDQRDLLVPCGKTGSARAILRKKRLLPGSVYLSR